MIYVYIVLTLVVAIAIRLWFIKQLINYEMLRGTGGFLVEEERIKAEKEWYDLSWSGKDPMRVIRIATRMTDHMDGYKQPAHLASSFYSQVKHLLKKGKILVAIAFFIEAYGWARIALAEREGVPQEERKPIELEVLGAPAFMLASIPLVGLLFKKQALSFLEEANRELFEVSHVSVDPPEESNVLQACLIWSKLWSLTHKVNYRIRVQTGYLRRDMDQNQLGRIAKHLGFKSNEELFKFCNI